MRVQSRIGAEAYTRLLRLALGAIAAALVAQVAWTTFGPWLRTR
jgi:hypothetical protein